MANLNDTLKAHLIEAERGKLHMSRLGIPEHMHDGLSLYINHGVEPGSFLVAVLENNLREAVARADEKNKNALNGYVRYLYNHAPSACWGSTAKVSDWIACKKRQETPAAHLAWIEAKLAAGMIEAPVDPDEQTDAEYHGQHERFTP